MDCWLTPELVQKLSARGIEIRALFPALMVLHDIGKPQSFLEHHKEDQHAYTKPIQRKKLQALGYTPAEVDLANALMDNDWLGDYLMGRFTVAETVDGLRNFSSSVGLTVQEYFRLQMIFFSADAGSYPILETNMFETDARGCMEPKHQMYVGGESKPYIPDSSDSEGESVSSAVSLPEASSHYSYVGASRVKPNEHAYDDLKHAILTP